MCKVESREILRLQTLPEALKLQLVLGCDALEVQEIGSQFHLRAIRRNRDCRIFHESRLCLLGHDGDVPRDTSTRFVSDL